jgi:hypothetical protein
MSADRRFRSLRRTAITCGAVALAVALTWPLAAAPTTRLPLGTEEVASVPLLNAWTVWWNADRAKYGFTGYWDAPIFAPARYAFAFSEAQPTTLAVAPLTWAVGPAFAYNAYLLAVLVLNGLVAYRLLRRIGLAVVPSILGGAAVETLPFVHWQLGVLQLTTACGVLWGLDRLVALRDQPAGLNAVLLGLAAAVCYAACNYWGMFLSVLIPAGLPALVWGRWRDGRFWAWLGASGAVAALISLPILWVQWAAKKEYAWHRDESLLVSLSAHPRDYLTTPWRPAIVGPVPGDPDRPLWMLGPGVIKITLAAAGVLAGLLTRGRRRWTLFLLLFAAAAFGLSLGPGRWVYGWWPTKGVVTWSPYKVLMAVHPGLKLARSPFRFCFFVQIAVALLAAGLLDGLWVGVRRLAGNWRTWPRRSAVGFVSTVLLLVGLLAAIEVWPAPQRLYDLPRLDQNWIAWLRGHTDPAAPIVTFPFPEGTGVGDYERTALFMYEQVGYRRPMAEGYSGFFPDDFLNLREKLFDFPAPQVLDELERRGVKTVVIDSPEWAEMAGDSPRLRLDFRDEDAKVSVYSILPSVAPRR